MNPPPLKSVVIVDDDGPFLKMVSQLLAENLSCPVIAFMRPKDALAALPRISPGIIVTDFEMPDLNGFEFMAKAEKVVPEIPFILITGYPLAAIERRLEASPAVAVVSKPFGWQKLADAVIRHWPEAARPLVGANPASV